MVVGNLIKSVVLLVVFIIVGVALGPLITDTVADAKFNETPDGQGGTRDLGGLGGIIVFLYYLIVIGVPLGLMIKMLTDAFKSGGY